MADLTTTPSYDAVYQLEDTDDVQGGAGGISNSQAQSLGNRDDYLKSLIEATYISTGLTFTLFSSDFGAPYYNVGYCVIGKTVFLCGTIACTVGAGLINILNLDPSIVPANKIQINCTNNFADDVTVQITPATSAMSVTSAAGVSGYIYLDGVSYRLS